MDLLIDRYLVVIHSVTPEKKMKERKRRKKTQIMLRTTTTKKKKKKKKERVRHERDHPGSFLVLYTVNLVLSPLGEGKSDHLSEEEDDTTPMTAPPLDQYQHTLRPLWRVLMMCTRGEIPNESTPGCRVGAHTRSH